MTREARTTNKERITVIIKPQAASSGRVGEILSFFEMNGFRLLHSVQKVSLGRLEVKDCYSLIGLNFTESDEESWGLLYDSETDPVFSFVLEREYAHKKVDELEPHRTYPLIYIKKK